jgi:hypothetical protein
MMSDYFTKPLQGAQFRKLRDLIMNIDPKDENLWDHRSVLSRNKKICGTDSQTNVGTDGKSRNGVTQAHSNHTSESEITEQQDNAHSI